MERIDKLIAHPQFKNCMDAIKKAEETRKFCKHDLEHCLDVARIATILNMDENLGFKREVIYATALLHDIGRAQEYAGGDKHSSVGAKLAREILESCNFNSDESKEIVTAIFYHSSKESSENKGQRSLAYLLYRSDKESRNCFLCDAIDECYWPDETKKHKLNI